MFARQLVHSTFCMLLCAGSHQEAKQKPGCSEHLWHRGFRVWEAVFNLYRPGHCRIIPWKDTSHQDNPRDSLLAHH